MQGAAGEREAMQSESMQSEAMQSLEQRLREGKTKTKAKAQPEDAGESTPARGVGPKVFLIRHADAKEGEKDADRGMHLSSIGERQAEALAKRLAGWQIDAILCSDMYRALETAKAVHSFHANVPLIVDETFREVSTGTIEAYRKGDPAHGGLPARLEAAWQKIMTLPYRVAVVVTHGGLIKYLVGRAIRYDRSLKPHFSSGHTGITAMQVKPGGGAHLQFFNDTHHLSPDLGPMKMWLEDKETGRWRFGHDD